MKLSSRILVLLLILVGAKQVVFAQEVGIRSGQMAVNQVAFDVTAPTGNYGKVHSNLSLGNQGIGADVLYDFYIGSFPKQNGLTWYAGAGGTTYFIDNLRVGPAIEIGLQYDFMHDPFSISFDWRPTYWLINESDADDFQYYSFGINLRYSFLR